MQNFIVRAEKYLKLTKKKSKLAFKKKIIMDKRQQHQINTGKISQEDFFSFNLSKSKAIKKDQCITP